MILLWIILDQRKTEKECKKYGCEPACSLEDRLEAYRFFVLLPIIIIILL